MSSDRRGLVVVDNQLQLQPCHLYKHNPGAGMHGAILEDHHIAPLSWWVAAGKDPNLSPKVGLCGVCHGNVHAAIDSIIKKQGFDVVPDRCKQLAWQAFSIAEANGLTPSLTL